MIDHASRCLYVHIPKTGGNSINRVFGVGWEDHKDLGRYAAEIEPEVLASYCKFAIVRNPWDRLLSDYNYQVKKSRSNKLYIHTDTGEKRRFGEWVRAVLSDPYRYDATTWGGDVSEGIHRWSPQVDWISRNGEIAVDRILRMESLSHDFRELLISLGRPVVSLPHRNRRLHWHYSWYYDAATRDLVADYYAADIATFGYRFEARGAQQLVRRTTDWLSSLIPAAPVVPLIDDQAVPSPVAESKTFSLSR